MELEKYLEKIQKDESIFPMDSFPTRTRKRRKQILHAPFPNENLIVVEQRRAMIDLDGTIHKYSKGYADGTLYDNPFEGAKRTIDWLKNNGYEIIIFTTRASEENSKVMGGNHEEEIEKVENYLKHHDIYFDRITAEKLPADFYVDDKAIVIKNGDWDAVLKTIKTRTKYS